MPQNLTTTLSPYICSSDYHTLHKCAVLLGKLTFRRYHCLEYGLIDGLYYGIIYEEGDVVNEEDMPTTAVFQRI